MIVNNNILILKLHIGKNAEKAIKTTIYQFKSIIY